MKQKQKAIGLGVMLLSFGVTVAIGVQMIKRALPQGPADDGEILASSTEYFEQGTMAVDRKPEFHDTFSGVTTLSESGSMKSSSSKQWWLNSGGLFYTQNGVGKTIHGSLDTYNKWRLLYSVSNPTDTDDGYHPQNIFRLVTRSKWNNFTQEVYFAVRGNQLSSSPQRNESNGVLLFNRYQDGKTLYYVGIRVDGKVVVKKKFNGTYYTMGYKPLFVGQYNRDSNPNLLPMGKWIGLQSDVTTDAEGRVVIVVSVDSTNSGQWTEHLRVIDNGSSFGNKVIDTPGFAGIRTDFMDVEFKNYKITEK